jgi:phosphatidylethanolamine-binding protein (PEBP) family uncharacterized protein
MKLRLPLCLSLLVLAAISVAAKDLATYQLGDVADTDLTTPVAVDVTDAAATAALKTARAQQFPAIFRQSAEVTNALRRDFLAAFALARTNFLADLEIEFHSRALSEATIGSADFGRLVTVFDVENRAFPIADDLAAQWARGGDAEASRDKLLATLMWVAGRAIRPDALPADMTLAEAIRLVPVTNLNQSLTFEGVQAGSLTPANAVLTLSSAQNLFRREFPPEQQVFARALAAFIKPNCFPDAPFTKLTRGTAVYQMVVADHFDAGDVIVHKGETIDAKARAIITAVIEKLSPEPAAPAAPLADVPIATESPASPPAATFNATRQPSVSDLPVRAGPSHSRHLALILSLTAISLGAFALAGWQMLRNRKRSQTFALATQNSLPLNVAVPADLNPQVAQAVREAVQQELAMQRRELLLAQQTAADEIGALVQRLDDLQVPMQQRLHTYESRIHALESELALRNEENRQLLKLKIEMVSRQLATERATTMNTSFSA